MAVRELLNMDYANASFGKALPLPLIWEQLRPRFPLIQRRWRAAHRRFTEEDCKPEQFNTHPFQ